MFSFESSEVQPGNCKKERRRQGEGGERVMQMVLRGQKRTQPGQGRKGRGLKFNIEH